MQSTQKIATASLKKDDNNAKWELKQQVTWLDSYFAACQAQNDHTELLQAQSHSSIPIALSTPALPASLSFLQEKKKNLPKVAPMAFGRRIGESGEPGPRSISPLGYAALHIP